VPVADRPSAGRSAASTEAATLITLSVPRAAITTGLSGSAASATGKPDCSTGPVSRDSGRAAAQCRLLAGVARRSPIATGAQLFAVGFAGEVWEISVAVEDFIVVRPLDSVEVSLGDDHLDSSFVGPFPLSQLSSSEQRSTAPQCGFARQLPPP
jgi:hypothetical protein